jgi:hypothetical protein
VVDVVAFAKMMCGRAVGGGSRISIFRFLGLELGPLTLGFRTTSSVRFIENPLRSLMVTNWGMRRNAPSYIGVFASKSYDHVIAFRICFAESFALRVRAVRGT